MGDDERDLDEKADADALGIGYAGSVCDMPAPAADDDQDERTRTAVRPPVQRSSTRRVPRGNLTR